MAGKTKSETSAAADRDAALRASYAAAEKRLREAHPAEFNRYRAEEAKARGVEWTAPLSPEEKAAAKVAALVAEFGDGILPPVPQSEDGDGADG